MADSAEGNSTADAKKKATALDEDFGKDFLSFWGSSKKGKDKIDFDMDEVTQNTKKSFNFDKLDDFELGGDFDKLPSFKVDMPDLDFSTPGMNNDKSTEKQIGKKESRKENFSFNFDFNELDKFDLDPSPVEINKKPSKHADSNTSDYSYKHVLNEDSRSKSDTSADASNDLENTKQLNKDSKATSRSESLTMGTIIKDIRSSISQDLEHHDTFHEVWTSTAKQIVVTDANKNDTHGNEGCREPTQETGFIRTNIEKTNQDCMLQSISANCSAQEDNPQIRIRPTSSDALKTDPVRAEDDSTRTVDSSKPRNGSPINSYNTRCDPVTILVQSSNSSGDSQKHCKWNQNEVTSGKDVRNHSIQCQMGIQNASFTDCPQNIASRMMNTGDRQNSGSKFIISPLQRGSVAVNPKSLNDKLASALQLNSLRLSAENASRRTLSPTKRQQDFVYNNKLESLNICPANDSRESNENQDQAETWKVGISKSSGEGSIKCISQRDDDQSDTSRFHLDHSDLQQSPTATNSARLAHNFLSSTASIRCSKTAPVEISDAFLKDKTNCDNRLTISSLKKLNSDSPNSATLKEAKSVRFSERRLEFPLKSASKTASSVLTEKSGPTDLLLKTKTVEESTDDPENINPVKPSMESVIGRKPLEVAQKVERMAVPEPENLEVDRNVVNCTDVLASISVANLKSKTMEVPLLTNKDGQVEKTKVLDDTCFENDSMRTVDSSQSRNTSPDNSFYSRCNQELSMVKVINADEGFQEHQGNQNEVTKGKNALSEPDQYQMETPDASFTDVSKKVVHRVKNSSRSENQNAHTVAAPSSLQSAKTVKSMTMKEKVIAAIQSKSFSISAENVPLKSSAATQKEPSLDARKLEALNISPVNENRFSKQTPEQTRTQKVDILKLYEKGSTKGITAISRGQDRDTSRFQLKTSSLQLQTIGSNSAKCIIPNSAFGIASMKSSEILPIEVNGSSLEHMTSDSRLTTSITKLKGKAQNDRRSKVAKSARFPESNSEFPLNTAWMANITVKSASLATPLKRKILEDSTNDPKNSTPLKRIMESTIGRKPFEVSPKTESMVVPITENLEASHDDGCAENLNSNGVTESGGLSMGLEVLAPLEKDEIVEKAEAYSKELDDMCGMLRKKHEEARELLVRAVVNNNTLHMLKNSLLDEKIHSLQKFAPCLSEKF